jgi:hypothetical protein
VRTRRLKESIFEFMDAPLVDLHSPPAAMFTALPD